MKTKSENIALLILCLAVAYPVIAYFTLLYFPGQKTGDDNREFRLAFLQIVNNLQISVTSIIMYKLGERKNG